MENFKDVPVQDSAADGDPNIGLSRSKFYLFVGKSTPWSADSAIDNEDGFLQPRLTMSQHAGTSVVLIIHLLLKLVFQVLLLNSMIMVLRLLMREVILILQLHMIQFLMKCKHRMKI